MNDVQIIINYFNLGNYDEAITRSKKLLKKKPNFTNLYNVIGISYQKKGMHDTAKKTFLKGLQFDPYSIDLILNLGNLYKYENSYDLAQENYERILKEKPKHLLTLINYGNLKNIINSYEESLTLYNRALEVDNNNFTIHFNKAFLLQTIGRFEEAIHHSKKCLELNPNFTPADNLLSRIINYNDDDWHLDSMLKKIENKNLSPYNKWNLLFSLGFAYEKLENKKKAMSFIMKANLTKRESIKYNINEDISQFNNIKKQFKNINFDSFDIKESTNKKIIFILGMPRSGSTLVEQIISSHSKIYGAGELPVLQSIIKNNIFNNSEHANSSNSNSLFDVDFKNLQEQYIKFLSFFENTEKFITDKNPSNFLWIGFIKIMFPNAKIIHSHRAARENCLSIYKNLFPGSDLAWCYDQTELGKYYNLYKDLMNFWNDLLPNYIYNIKYEDLVSDQEKQSKMLIKACGLDWEEQCLNFHKNSKPIRTLSINQARQKIYKTSLNLSDNYNSELKQLFSILTA